MIFAPRVINASKGKYTLFRLRTGEEISVEKT